MNTITTTAVYEQTYNTPPLIPDSLFKKLIEDRTPRGYPLIPHPWADWRSAQRAVHDVQTGYMMNVSAGKQIVMQENASIEQIEIDFISGHDPGRYYTGLEVIIHTTNEPDETTVEDWMTMIFPFWNDIEVKNI